MTPAPATTPPSTGPTPRRPNVGEPRPRPSTRRRRAFAAPARPSAPGWTAPARPAAPEHSLAAEGSPAYSTGNVGGPGHDVPLGLPILEELPELAGVLEDLRAADRFALRALLVLATNLDAERVRVVSGVVIEHWLGIVATQTRLDRRSLLRTARLLTRFPALRNAADAGQVTFSQLRALSLVLRGAAQELDQRLDELISVLAPELLDADPDAIVKQVRSAIERWTDPERPITDEPPVAPYLALQPRLDGTGGRLSGELDAAGLALLDAATAPGADQRDHPGGVGAARADNLLGRLAGAAGVALPDDLLGRLAGAAGVALPDDGGSLPAPPAPPPVELLVRIDLATLLGHDDTPADLLTRLLGGRLRLDARSARQLIDANGGAVRGVVVDEQGQVLGVGRRDRIPPGWLRDALLAVHDTCTGPLCDRPARGADLDHAIPWWPDDPDTVPGSTDVDNVGPLCAATNRAVARNGWRATPLGGGRRRWVHVRSGLRITTVPTTWRPWAGGDPPRRPEPTDVSRLDSSDPPAAGADPPF